jgi:hypothetical protein
MSAPAQGALEQLRRATDELIAASAAADADGLAAAAGRRGAAVERLAALRREGLDIDDGAWRELDLQAGRALEALLELRQQAREALARLARGAAAIRRYESIPAGQALDQSA